MKVITSALLSVCVAQCGWLLTIANLGDSRAVMDTGAQILQLSVDHRVATHRAERHRLESTGALIAPIDVSGKPPAIVIQSFSSHHRSTDVAAECGSSSGNLPRRKESTGALIAPIDVSGKSPVIIIQGFSFSSQANAYF